MGTNQYALYPNAVLVAAFAYCNHFDIYTLCFQSEFYNAFYHLIIFHIIYILSIPIFQRILSVFE